MEKALRKQGDSTSKTSTMIEVKRFFKGHATLAGRREESAFGFG